MIKFLLFLAIGALVCTAGCTDREDGERDPAYAAAPTSTEDEGEDARWQSTRAS
ncbi:MAG TPA: hypothetical protein PLX30_08500 [Methanothrix sp.]|nr:hypothetical protein [Methanothrix sp.]